ncbi:DUF2332 domain-containing protein [Brevibacterium salitolerans]|uniref:DUF2332 domain-containing protein n=1 Tax=Brevibacterium salitolerans TaxID=1403566 RepID=A0ABN2WV78_9MICO
MGSLVVARGVADDEDLLRLLLELPAGKRQPNLFFAAARHCGAPPSDYSSFGKWVRDHWEPVRRTVLERATQTNEAGRCAALLPFLSSLAGPLALIEVGASAGLCLYPDRYSYEFTGEGTTIRLDPADGPSTAVLPCALDGVSTPSRLPHVVWRAGIDLNPLHVTDADDRAWLSTLKWPEHEQRRSRLEAAAAIAAVDPPVLVEGDLSASLDSLVAAAPAEATVVVFHTAVLAYLSAEDRRTFSDRMLARKDLVWVSNEGVNVLPHLAEEHTLVPDGRFVLCVDGVPIARTGPHGQSCEALD